MRGFSVKNSRFTLLKLTPTYVSFRASKLFHLFMTNLSFCGYKTLSMHTCLARIISYFNFISSKIFPLRVFSKIVTWFLVFNISGPDIFTKIYIMPQICDNF